MFKNPLFEALSKVPYYVPLIVYIPVILYFFWASIQTNGILMFLAHLVLGLLIWTLTEYVLHRFVFHFYPSSEWGKRIHFIFHGVHHDYPNDVKRLVMPLGVSIPLALGVYFALYSFLPPVYLYPFFSAFVLGYVFYDTVHYALHHFNFKGEFWKKIKKHHMLHHYSDASKGFGVSSELWDKVLNSGFPKKK